MQVNARVNITNAAREEVESLWVELYRGKNNKKVIVGVCYRPPNLREEEESDLLSQLGRAARQGNVIIMGDFNYPDID